MKLEGHNLELCKFLKEARIRKGLTQKEVALHLGLTGPQFVSNYERGLCEPTLVMLKKLIQIYAVDVNLVIQLIVNYQKAQLAKALD